MHAISEFQTNYFCQANSTTNSTTMLDHTTNALSTNGSSFYQGFLDSAKIDDGIFPSITTKATYTSPTTSMKSNVQQLFNITPNPPLLSEHIQLLVQSDLQRSLESADSKQGQYQRGTKTGVGIKDNRGIPFVDSMASHVLRQSRNSGIDADRMAPLSVFELNKTLPSNFRKHEELVKAAVAAQLRAAVVASDYPRNVTNANGVVNGLSTKPQSDMVSTRGAEDIKSLKAVKWSNERVSNLSSLPFPHKIYEPVINNTWSSSNSNLLITQELALSTAPTATATVAVLAGTTAGKTAVTLGPLVGVDSAEAVEGLVTTNCHRDVAVLYLLLMLGTVWMAVYLLNFTKT
ncbi:unnamed protein product [Protopolystoma xenopodis]|uniref:Uncharacterized protein n=1 Tax=Protopolystoma xenopodis TaxID=117903 RepID=A0A448WIJ9_9PLAT|nr:unnamed protein product [Protopolystoma xenopodis]